MQRRSVLADRRAPHNPRIKAVGVGGPEGKYKRSAAATKVAASSKPFRAGPIDVRPVTTDQSSVAYKANVVGIGAEIKAQRSGHRGGREQQVFPRRSQ
jgi:hypothetical protein